MVPPKGMRATYPCAVLLLLAGTAAAMGDGPRTVTFAKSFSDHMVLQAAPKRAQVWGWSSPSTGTVEVVVADSAGTPVFNASSPIAANGRWTVLLPSVNASADAYSLSATLSGATGMSPVTLTDTLFGEVWVCGGQSNMEYVCRARVRGVQRGGVLRWLCGQCNW